MVGKHLWYLIILLLRNLSSSPRPSCWRKKRGSYGGSTDRKPDFQGDRIREGDGWELNRTRVVPQPSSPPGRSAHRRAGFANRSRTRCEQILRRARSQRTPAKCAGLTSPVNVLTPPATPERSFLGDLRGCDSVTSNGGDPIAGYYKREALESLVAVFEKNTGKRVTEV